MSTRYDAHDDTNWDRVRARFLRFLRTRTVDQWIMFLACAVVGAFLA